MDQKSIWIRAKTIKRQVASCSDGCLCATVIYVQWNCAIKREIGSTRSLDAVRFTGESAAIISTTTSIANAKAQCLRPKYCTMKWDEQRDAMKWQMQGNISKRLLSTHKMKCFHLKVLVRCVSMWKMKTMLCALLQCASLSVLFFNSCCQCIRVDLLFVNDDSLMTDDEKVIRNDDCNDDDDDDDWKW